MHCFNHPDVQACGICKSCQRALCRTCVSDVGKSIACQGRCESDVSWLDEMLKLNIELMQTTDYKKLTTDSTSALASSRAALTGTVLFMLVLGAIFLAYAAYDSSAFLALLGAALFGFGLFDLVRMKWTARNADDRPRSAGANQPGSGAR